MTSTIANCVSRQFAAARSRQLPVGLLITSVMCLRNVNGVSAENKRQREARERERQREARVNEDGRRPSSGLRVAGGVESRNLLR